jgi:hypothetical protein
VAGFLLTNGIIQLRYIHAPIGKPLACFIGAALLVLSFSFYKLLKRRLRYLPGLLSSLCATIMIFTTWDEVAVSDLPWPMLFYVSGFLFVVVGLTQLLIDGKRWMSMSSRSVRLKNSMFEQKRHPWSTIEEVTVEETDILILLKDGQTIRVQPEHCDMQHLRSRVDIIFRSAHSDPSRKSNTGDLMQDMFGA